MSGADRALHMLGARRVAEPGWVPDPPGGKRPATVVVAAAGDPVAEAESTVDPPDRDGAGGDPDRRRVGRHRTIGTATLAIPAVLRSSRIRPGWTAVLGLLVVTVLAAAWFSVRVATAASAARPMTVGAAATTSTPAPAVAPGLPPGTSTAGVATTSGAEGPARITVHVVGEVADPGVVHLPEGARVTDAIEAAGGALTTADLKRINLARKLGDGEQVHVPAPGEPILSGAFGPTVAAASAAGSSTPVNLNSASAQELESLPGVGPVLAQRILDWRVAQGRFSSVEELGEVRGIGEKLLAQLTPKVTV